MATAKPTYTPKDREKREALLMKEGCWEIRAHTKLGWSLLNSFIQHYCPVYETKRYWYALPLIDHICEGCKEHPPESIMGLWKLHNMDYIQAGKSY